jgi:O-acetyl-ADP-ribose deacetylase
MAKIVDYIQLIDKKKIIRLVKGDITERAVDVIVNAANSYLKHGGGVAGAIVRKGGGIIQKESDKIGFVPVGSSVITGAGKLPCKAVIHTASERNFRSISMPAISSGIFGFPKARCAEILVEEAKKYLMSNATSLEIIEFCVIDDETTDYFKKEFVNMK